MKKKQNKVTAFFLILHIGVLYLIWGSLLQNKNCLYISQCLIDYKEVIIAWWEDTTKDSTSLLDP